MPSGLSIKKIADEVEITIHATEKILGVNRAANNAFNKIHMGHDLDTTGMFHRISTMRWV